MSEWHDAEKHAERAQRFYRAGQWERALDALTEALELRPDQAEWLFGLGLTLEALERYDEAVDAFRQALDQGGDDVEVLLHLGKDLTRSGDYHDAIETLEKVNELDPECSSGYTYRVLAHAMLGDHETAETMFYMAQQVDETDEVAYEHLAQSLIVRGELDRAVYCLRQAIKLNPQHPDANGTLAVLYRSLNNLDKSRQYFQRQLRVTPYDPQVLLEFADLLYASNRLAEAGDKCRRALDIDPTLAAAHHRLGDLALINGHTAAAADRYERAMTLDPDRAGVHLGMAALRVRQGKTELACEHLKRELEIEGQDAGQVLELAGLLVEVDMHDDAVYLLNPLLSGADDLLLASDRNYATGLLCRGIALIATGHIERGLSDCRRSLQLDAESVAAMLQLAGAYLELGELGRASAWLRRGLAADPNEPNLRLLRRRLRWAQTRQLVRRVLRRG